jgi:dCTP deaminase
MGTVVLMAKAGAQSHVDPQAYLKESSAPAHHDTIREKKQKHERFDVPYEESFLLHPGTLALVPTLEWVKLPHDLQGVVTARSSWAREGLSIATATIINPGYAGIVTLELANLGGVPMRLYPGLRLAQIALYELICNDTESDKAAQKSQFHMSFEPSGGNIAGEDGPFIPNRKS